MHSLASALAFAISFCLCAQQPASRPAERAIETAPDGTITLRGRVLVVDLNGKVHEHAQGRAAVLPWFGTTASHLPVEIVDGQWTAVVPKAKRGDTEFLTEIALADCEVEQGPVLVHPEKIAARPDAELVFRLQVLPDQSLRVADATTGQDLAGIEVVGAPWETRSFVHPGNRHPLPRVTDAAKSPVALPPPELHFSQQTRALWVRAQEHAWHYVELPVTDPKPRDVRLVRGGGLRVAVTGKPPQAPGRVGLRLYRDAASPVADFACEDGKVEPIEGLVPGKYEARLELGEWFREPQVLARREVTIEAGRVVELALAVAGAGAAPPRVLLQGTLALPEAWLQDQHEKPHFHLEAIGDTVRWQSEWLSVHHSSLAPGQRPGEFAFEVPNVVAGDYEVVVKPGDYRCVIAVDEKGTTRPRLQVPEPAEVQLRVVDAATAAPVLGVTLLWHREFPPGVSGGGLEQAHAMHDSNVVRLVAAAGRISLQAMGADLTIAPRELEVRPGKNEIEIKATRLCGVRIVLAEGGALQPVGEGWKASLRSTAGEPKSTTWRGNDTVFVNEPGLYRLHIDGPDAFEPVPDRDIRVSAGVVTDVDVNVVRKKR